MASTVCDVTVKLTLIQTDPPWTVNEVSALFFDTIMESTHAVNVAIVDEPTARPITKEEAYHVTCMEDYVAAMDSVRAIAEADEPRSCPTPGACSCLAAKR